MSLSDLWQLLGSPQFAELTALLALILSQKESLKKEKKVSDGKRASSNLILKNLLSPQQIQLSGLLATRSTGPAVILSIPV